MVIWPWLESQCSWFPRGGSEHHWCGDWFFSAQRSFLAIFSPNERHIYHPDHGRQPPNSGPNHPNPYQTPPPPSRMSPRPASVAAALIQWPQRSQSPPRLPTSEPTMARGDILPPSERIEARYAHKNNTRRRNNQSESGRGNVGVEKDTNNTTISRNAGGIVEKI